MLKSPQDMMHFGQYQASSAVLGWQSQVETEHYSIVYFDCLKYCSAELPLMMELIHTCSV